MTPRIHRITMICNILFLLIILFILPASFLFIIRNKNKPKEDTILIRFLIKNNALFNLCVYKKQKVFYFKLPSAISFLCIFKNDFDKIIIFCNAVGCIHCFFRIFHVVFHVKYIYDTVFISNFNSAFYVLLF